MIRGNNLARIFTEIVSIDAWRTSFDTEKESATVHVDLSFLEANLGSEEESKVRFNLALTRAELVFCIPATEPLKVIQNSVDREPSVEGLQKYMRENRTGIGFSADAALAISNRPFASAGVAASTEKRHQDVTVTETTVPVSQFSMKQSTDQHGNYRWEITSERGQTLNGKVWDPVKRPRLSIKRFKNTTIQPSCRVVVKCRRQDFFISNLQLKSNSR
jgi:hypothetical protein